MGLTKQYLRYAPSGTFNVIASPSCNSTHISLNGISGRYVAVGACEHVIVWDMRLGEKAQVIPGENVVVSQIAASPTGNHMAVGYVDGNINVFELLNNEVVCVFAGHKSAITCLQYDEQGHRIVSGSKDTEVILWDVVSETGVARFSGHKDAITSVLFLNTKNCVISASKDTFVKFWDIETKHCFKTLGGHQMEVWSSVLLKEERYLVTGSMDQELRVWKLNWTDKLKEEEKVLHQLEIVKLEETTEDSSMLQCHQVGTLVRGGRGRVVGLCTDPGQTVLACYGTDSLLELFAFCSDDEANARMSKRVKKQRKKLSKLKESGEVDADTTEVSELLTLTDEVRRLTSVKLSSKIKSATLLMGTTGELRVGVTLSNNTVELHSLKIGEDSEVKCLKQITQHGHQREPRCVAISSDNLAVLSAAADSVKLWNRTSQTCVRTVPMSGGRPCSACFAPGDRHALVGCSDGSLLLLDVASAHVSERIPAHTDACSSVGLLPDLRGCYSGSADKTVKLWQFELIPDPTGESKAKVLSILHTRTLELEEAVCAVKVSPNNKFIAVALMDSTVKIFFLDTFKFFLSLYGHKLPVLCMDMSSDSALIATGSSDRNVKVWGLDFGDCHRSLFAHNDSVTSLHFVPNTHQFFTASKDGKVKQWDADTCDNIITLNGHAGACWGISVGAGGLHAISCGADGALRLFTRTDEPLVLGDTDEAEEGLATGEQHAPVPGLPGLVMPTKKTIGAEKAADSLLECLTVGAEYKKEVTEARGQYVQPPLLMAAYNCSTSEDFLLEVLKKIRSSELEEALLLLPLSSAGEMVRLLASLLDRGEHTELLCRAALFLVKVHRAPLLADRKLLKHLIQIQAKAAMRLAELRDMVGYNLHALQWMRREVEQSESEQLFKVAVGERKAKDSRRRARQAVKRPIVTAPVPGLPGLVMPTKKTIGAEKAADSLLECLTVGAEYKKEVTEARGQYVQPPLLMAAYNCSTSEDFLLEVLKKIRSSELEEALLLLPLSSAGEMVRLLASLLDRGEHTELLCRAALFLVKVHRAPLLADRKLLKHLIQIQAKAAMRLAELRDMVGYNLHALQWMRREVEQSESEQLFKVAVGERKAKDSRRRARQAVKRPIVTAPVPGLPGLVMPTKKTIGAEKAADSLLECLTVGAEYKKKVTEARGQYVQPPLLMAAYNCSTSEDFLLEVLKKIRSSELEEALLLLPLSSAGEMVRLLASLLDRGEHTELLCRAALFLVKVHRAPLLADRKLLKHLIQIQAKAAMRLAELRDMVGYNLHALQWMRREVEQSESEQLFKVAVGERKAKDSRRRARQAVKRPIVTVT